MSFYLGGNSAGTNLLHLTRTAVNSVSDMQNRILPSTFFHSSLPLVQVKELRVTKVAVPRYNGFTLGGNGAFKLHNDDIDYLSINRGTVYTLTVYNNSWINVEALIVRATVGDGSASILTGMWRQEGNSSSFIASGYPTRTSNTYVSAIAFNSVRMFAISLNPLQFTSNTIEITPYKFDVRGVDLSKISFLSYGIINSADLAVYIPGSGDKYLQFIGIRADGGPRSTAPVEISSTPAETYISFGWNKAFTSLSAGYSLYQEANSRQATIPVSRNSVTDIAIPVSYGQSALAFLLVYSETYNAIHVCMPITVDYFPESHVFFTQVVYEQAPYQEMLVSVPSPGIVRIRTTKSAGITGYGDMVVKVIILK